MSKPIGIVERLGFIAAATCFVACWSSGFLVAKIGTADTPPITLLLWRFISLTVILWLVLLTRRARLPRAEMRHQAVVGLFSQLGYVLPVYGAIALGVSSGTTSLVDAIQPIVVATLVGTLLGLRVRRSQWAGLLVAFVGVAVIVASDLTAATAPGWAYALPLAAVISLVAATFLEGRRESTAPLMPMLTVHVTVSTVVLFVLALLTETGAPPSDAGFWASVLFLALVPTLAGYGLYWFLLRRAGITLLNALLFLVVPTTTVAGALLFGEPFTVSILGGLLLCAAGVATVIRGDRRSARRAPEQPITTVTPRADDRSRRALRPTGR